jgi:hypothetical protein
MYPPPYLAYLKILHLLEQTIVFVFQRSSLVIYLQSSIMSTSLSEDCAVCGKKFKRLGAHLVCTLACGSYYMPHRADTDECRGSAGSNVLEGADHGTRPNLRSSSHSTLFRPHRATVRGEAEDNPPPPPVQDCLRPQNTGDCPRFQTDIAVNNVRLLVAPFCSTALLLPFLRPPTPRRLGSMVWPSPAAWQVRSVQRHFGQQQRDDDQAR